MDKPRVAITQREYDEMSALAEKLGGVGACQLFGTDSDGQTHPVCLGGFLAYVNGKRDIGEAYQFLFVREFDWTDFDGVFKRIFPLTWAHSERIRWHHLVQMVDLVVVEEIAS